MLVVNGADDYFVPADDTRVFEGRAGVTVELIPGTGHCAMSKAAEVLPTTDRLAAQSARHPDHPRGGQRRIEPGGEEVLVVGAGPVGLVMACELARRKVPVRVIDKLPAPTTESRAILLHATEPGDAGAHRGGRRDHRLRRPDRRHADACLRKDCWRT